MAPIFGVKLEEPRIYGPVYQPVEETKSKSTDPEEGARLKGIQPDRVVPT